MWGQQPRRLRGVVACRHGCKPCAREPRAAPCARTSGNCRRVSGYGPSFLTGAVVLPFAAAVDTTWNASLWTVALALLSAGGYWRLWSSAGRDGQVGAARWWRLAAFGVGVLAFSGALASPIARLAEQMFLWHMVQHILLVDVAPIFLLAGFDEDILNPLTRRLTRVRKVFAWLSRPVSAVVLYVGTLWLWHVPVLYNAALEQPLLHVLQHASLIAVGVIFWWHVLQPVPSPHAVRGPGVFPFMAATKVCTGILASLLTFLPERGFVYDFYLDQPRMWGLTAAADQQFGGAIMVTEELVLLTAAFAFMFVRMLSQADEDNERLERLRAKHQS